MNRIEMMNFSKLDYACNEAMNTLCTNLFYCGDNIRSVLVTSRHEQEGKSSVAINMLRTIAGCGKRVVLVDADLRRSYIASRYGFRHEETENQWGLAHYLAGMASETDIVYATNFEGAYVVPVGRTVTNALPLLNSARLKSLLQHLSQQFDYVLVDAAPVGTVIDAAQIAKSCDGTLLVVNYNSVRRQELIEVQNQLNQTGTPIIGTVLNMVEFDTLMSKKYYYKSYYKSYYTRDAYVKGSGKKKKSDKQKEQN